MIETTLRSWDEASVGALETMSRELSEVSARRQEIFENAMQETTTTDGNGDVSVGRAMSIEGETAKELSTLDERFNTAKKRVADANERTRLEIDSALASDVVAQKAVRRAYLRAANPSVYRGARDLSPFFEKAATLAGVGEQARADIARLRSEWIEEREVRFETFINARDEAERESAARAKNSDGDAGSIEANAREGMRRMQESSRERKRLRDDLEQIEATAFRRLQDLLVVEIGAEKAKELGELPAKKKSRTPMIQFGG
jgi:CHASE3 domain sensor protein